MAKRKKLRLGTLNEFCANCRKLIGWQQPGYNLYAKSPFDFLPKGEWVRVRFPLGPHILKIIGFIPEEDSRISQEGWDICFSVHSENCRNQLKEDLEQAEIEVKINEKTEKLKLFEKVESG